MTAWRCESLRDGGEEHKDISIFSYMGLPKNCLRRAARSIHVLEILWLYGPLTFTDIRRVLHSLYDEKVNDKVLNQILNSLRSNSLISDVVAVIAGSKKKFYVITSRGARGVITLRLADYMDKEYLRQVISDDKEYYDYVKALAYTYYMSSKKIRTVGEIGRIVLDNMEALKKIAEITANCLGEEYINKAIICLKQELGKKGENEAGDEKKKYQKILTKFAKLLRERRSLCGTGIDSMIIHVTKSRGRVEIYSGYYYRWNPIYAVASLFTTKKLDYERCNYLFYIKGDAYHIGLTLKLLTALHSYMTSYKVFREEILDEYYAEYGGSADVINPYSDYNIGYNIKPRNTVILVEGNHIEGKRLRLDLSELSYILGENILVAAKGLVELDIKLYARNITVIQEVPKNISLHEAPLLNLSLGSEATRVDIYLVYRNNVDTGSAIPRLSLENIVYSSIDKPLLITWRGKDFHQIHTMPEPPGCSDKEYLVGEIIDTLKKTPYEAFDRIKKLAEEYLVRQASQSKDYIIKTSINNTDLIPLCTVKEHVITRYLDEHNGKEIFAEGPLIRITRGETASRKHDKIVIHVLIPKNNS